MVGDTYKASASIYDAIYAGTGMKDYESEARRAKDIAVGVRGLRPLEMSLLDVACGTGLHLQYFAKWFKHVEGLDYSSAMLAIASQRLPRVPLHKGNMASILLNPAQLEHEPQFDVVTCLFSAIAYMHGQSMLTSAITEMASHVKRGGVLIIEPWLTTETFDPDKADGVEFLDEPDLKVARFSTTTLDTLVVNTRQVPVTRLRFDYMVKHADEPVMTFSEEHVLSMSSEDDFRRAFRGTDMEVTFDPDGLSSNGRGVYIARKVA